MITAFIRFYEELNEFLPPRKRKVPYPVSFQEAPSVKNLIESEGIPHTEIDLILVNGNPVGFSEKVSDQDHISVYPVFESFDISGVQALHLKPLRESRFIADVHLGKLARYLRMMGFDTLYDNYYSDHDLVRISREERRTILTRDRRLLMRKEVERGYWIRHERILEQAAEVIHRLDLSASVRLFSRCTRCNSILRSTEESAVFKQFPGYRFYPGTLFYECTGCGHFYWQGSHSARFSEAIRSIT